MIAMIDEGKHAEFVETYGDPAALAKFRQENLIDEAVKQFSRDTQLTAALHEIIDDELVPTMSEGGGVAWYDIKSTVGGSCRFDKRPKLDSLDTRIVPRP